MDKETTIFMLQAIERLSMYVLTGDYDPYEIDEIQQEAERCLFNLRREDFEDDPYEPTTPSEEELRNGGYLKED